MVNTVSNGRFVHWMFLVPLLFINRRYMGHRGAVKAVGGHGELEYSQIEAEAEAEMRKKVGENG